MTTSPTEEADPSPDPSPTDLPPGVRAAGAVLWRPAGGGGSEGPGTGVEVAVVHRPHHRDWSLPKGKVDAGETRAATAVRELEEETGFRAVLGRHLATVHYPVRGERKAVDFWDARATSGAFVANGETDALRWLAPDGAAALLTYPTDRDVLERFARAPHPLTTLLLVRHAKAGRRAEWSGPDAARPLDEQGHEQARRIAERLALHGVTRCHAVPRERCTATLAPLAASLGVDVVEEPALSDDAVAADPSAACERLLALARGEGTVALCAQGDGIPALVRDLAGRAAAHGAPATANRRLDAPPARKGSVWTLALDLHAPEGPRLVSADYVRDPGR